MSVARLNNCNPTRCERERRGMNDLSIVLWQILTAKLEDSEPGTLEIVMPDVVYTTKQVCESLGGLKLNAYWRYVCEYSSIDHPNAQLALIGFECREADCSSIRTTP